MSLKALKDVIWFGSRRTEWVTTKFAYVYPVEIHMVLRHLSTEYGIITDYNILFYVDAV